MYAGYLWFVSANGGVRVRKYNVRKTFQTILAGVLERFPGISARFLQFPFIFLKNRHFGHYGVLGEFPKAYPMGGPPLIEESENFYQKCLL